MIAQQIKHPYFVKQYYMYNKMHLSQQYLLIFTLNDIIQKN